MNAETRVDRRLFLYYGLWLALSVAFFWRACLALIHFSLLNDNASHVVLIPFISAWLIYIERKQVFRQVSFDYSLAIVLFTIAALSYLWMLQSPAKWLEAERLALFALALVLLWISGFALFFGRASLKYGRFPLLFLILTIPLPDTLMNHAIYLLQKGSADIAEIIFALVGVPALREGFVFHLAHVTIEVAKECSGIRSSMALLILALLIGHILLHSLWKQFVFVIAGLLIMVVKNGVRIATLTILSLYVDPGFLYGRLHHEGGVVFFLLGLVLLLPILSLLRRGEKSRETMRDSLTARNELQN